MLCGRNQKERSSNVRVDTCRRVAQKLGLAARVIASLVPFCLNARSSRVRSRIQNYGFVYNGQPDPTRPTNTANANPNPPTPADRVVPVHSCGAWSHSTVWADFVCVSGSVLSWPTRPNTTNIANANPNPATPADRVVPVHSWRLVIVPWGLIL